MINWTNKSKKEDIKMLENIVLIRYINRYEREIFSRSDIEE